MKFPYITIIILSLIDRRSCFANAAWIPMEALLLDTYIAIALLQTGGYGHKSKGDNGTKVLLPNIKPSGRAMWYR